MSHAITPSYAAKNKMVLDQPVAKDLFKTGRTIHFAVSPPEGRRFVAQFMPRVVRDQLDISKTDAIAIALDNNWIMLSSTLKLNGQLWVTLRANIESLKVERVYNAVLSLLEILTNLFTCEIRLEITMSNKKVEKTVVRRIEFARLKLFHYYDN
jgi:hypothetical protein